VQGPHVIAVQIGFATGQSESVRHATQVCVIGLHTPMGQSVLATQPTQVFEIGSHVGVAPEQKELAVQGTHWPCFMPLLAHAGPAALDAHSEFVVQGWQVWVATWQIGVMPAQSALVSQPTQLPDGVSQTLVAPVHWLLLVAEHWPHAPACCVFMGWHAGVGLEQFASVVHCWQTLFMHEGIEPPQSFTERHWTQVLLARSQRGALGVPAQSPSAAQSTQVPRLALPARRSHTGKIAPTQSALDLQARQVLVVGSQIGIVAGQSMSVMQLA
jgi:hypothetical protein